jgi:hypothetical protein
MLLLEKHGTRRRMMYDDGGLGVRPMNMQTLTLGKRRFVVIPEREFHRLQKKAGVAVSPEFAEDAMRELKSYRRTGKAAKWSDVKRKLGL